MEMNIIEALKERRSVLRPKPGESVGVVREIKESLPDGSLKKIGQRRISFLSKSPLKEDATVVLDFNEVDDYLPIEDYMPKFEKSGMHETPVNDWSGKVEDKILRKEMKFHIMENIEKLSEKYKTVLVLRDVQGFSTEEVADITRMTVPAVKSRLHRARLFLRERLSDYYVDWEERA